MITDALELSCEYLPEHWSMEFMCAEGELDIRLYDFGGSRVLFSWEEEYNEWEFLDQVIERINFARLSDSVGPIIFDSERHSKEINQAIYRVDSRRENQENGTVIRPV